MFVLVKLLQILQWKGVCKARSEGLQGSLERIPALIQTQGYGRHNQEG